MEYTKWAACWGNASSIHDQTEARFSRNITLRYPIRMVFDGNALRFHFSNLRGTQPIRFAACAAVSVSDKEIDPDTVKDITVRGEKMIVIHPGAEVCSDEMAFDVKAGMNIAVTMYLPDYTDMNTAVLITGQLSKGFYAYGDFEKSGELPLDLTRNTHWFYFLNTVDVLTEEKNHCLVCYGDSITAQNWPDDLAVRAWENGYRDIAIIRRAISGTRILREYDCITYAAYGEKGEKRFVRELNAAGCDRVILQHGINDIIHPVGLDVNPWRPMSDLPTAEEMEEGFTKLYIEPARKMGLKVYGGTLLPIKGWRTYADFREELKNEFNDWLRETDLLDGCVDFDLALRDTHDPAAFSREYDSGDHLHPSALGYKAMAEAVDEKILK